MVGTTGWKRCLGAVVCAVVLAVSGCGAVNPFAPVGTPSPSLAPTYDPDRPTPAAPKGHRWAEADENGVLVAVPSSWKVVDKKLVDGIGDTAAMKDLAQEFSLDPAQLEATIASSDVMVFGPRVKGYTPNVGVTSTTEPMPSASELMAAMQQMGGSAGKVGKTRTVSTQMGKALVQPYSAKVLSFTVHGRMILVSKGPKLVAVTVSHVSPKQVDAITNVILEHLQSY
ncbi:hypothetical protein [Oryzobacter telluris]|uniref:hypothetical protein n=1 Tax=Oryzobacter telluris TaxID=3149179 RepID=UPI00370D26D3